MPCEEASAVAAARSVGPSIVNRVLAATTPAAALLVPASGHGDRGAQVCEAELVARLKRLVDELHPDRCVNLRAAEAFERAARAFDMLSVGTGASDDAMPELRPGEHWWDGRGSDELERLLEHRAALAAALAVEAPELTALWPCIDDAERMCEHLDRSRGLTPNRRWPSMRRTVASAGAAGIASAANARLLDVVLHLRAVHRYCLLCGRSCDHAMELEALSPAAAAGPLLRRMIEQRASVSSTMAERDGAAGGGTSVTVDAVGPLEECVDDCGMSVDPLDVYMETIYEELRALPLPASDEPEAGASLAAPNTNVAAQVQDGARQTLELSMTRPAQAEARVASDVATASPARPPAAQQLACAATMSAAFATPGDFGAASTPASVASSARNCGKRPPAAVQAALVAEKRVPSVPPPGMELLQLATGDTVLASGAAARASAAPTPGLQDALLADLDSDGSEV
eukprot:NODE_6397_length_1675_cov_10.587209.p1 GENE.NODE_6397_length_1675_cov_10.587209~~NODE_6397_length_1675_cov_10.587209.p1  ORF type:complete len:499 (-),score=139.47 NODE_6397_length_1675_cov_10.587209:178-1554(-)